MSLQSPAPPELPLAPEPDGAGGAGRGRRARSPLLRLGGALLGILVLMAVAAPLLTPYDPSEISGQALETPSGRHWLGTDEPGRDIFALLVFGARTSLVVAVVSASLAMALAVLVGVVPALVGGVADALSNRAVVFLLALPGLPLLVLIGSLAGDRQMAIVLSSPCSAWLPTPVCCAARP